MLIDFFFIALKEEIHDSYFVKFITLLAHFFGLFIMSTFSGNIVCHIINKNALLPFDDLKGLLKETTYNFSSVKNWVVDQYLQVRFCFIRTIIKIYIYLN